MSAPDGFPFEAVSLDSTSSPDECASATSDWITEYVPETWRLAALQGQSALRKVRSNESYREWYPLLGWSGLVAPDWSPEYGGLGVQPAGAGAIATILSTFYLRPLNQLGLNNAAAALFAHGTETQRRRYLPPIVRNEERWCQLFSEPGAGSDLASLSTRATLEGDEWVITGQKVWTTWASESDFAILLARTDQGLPKNQGITYFLLDLRQEGVTIRPLRQMTGDLEFNEVFLDGARVPDSQRVGAVNQGWKVAGSTLSSERQMVARGSGSTRVGASSVDRLVALAKVQGRSRDPVMRDRLATVWIEERIRQWTNVRVATSAKAGGTPGPAASIGKVHQADLNQRIHVLAVDLLGAGATAWETTSEGISGSEGGARYHARLRVEVNNMLRSRANSIEGGTTEVNKNVLGERVLGLPREHDPWRGRPWNEVPR